MELTKTKLNKILKKYRIKLEQHNESWDALCKKKCKKKDLGNGQFEMTMPSIYDYERHNSKGAALFKDLMAEFEGYEVFPKKQLTLTDVSQQRELLEWLSNEDFFKIPKDEINEILEDYRTYKSNCG